MNENIATPTKLFFELTPERVLESVERLGVRCTGRVLALNSMENRVYEVELDLDDPPGASRWEAFRVVKFYRPARWAIDQIKEEHSFLQECYEADLPVVPPIPFPDGETVAEVAGTGIYFGIFPKVGGRTLDEMSAEELRRVGRLLGRLHAVGGRSGFTARPSLTVESYGYSNIRYLKEGRLIPASVEQYYLSLAERIFTVSAPWFEAIPLQRIHGDCHVGNILWSDAGCILVDFDDSVLGPCVQDLWLLAPGRDVVAEQSRDYMLEGYEMMRPFDRGTLRLIEPLRALRMVHFTCWIARRWEDPAFRRVFVDYGSERYWREQLIALQEVAETLGIA